VFLARAVQALIEQRGFALSLLVRDKYRLREVLADKIDGFRKTAHVKAFQTFLLPDCETPLVVRPEVCFTFKPGEYAYGQAYKGGHVFKKHFYEVVGDLKPGGEEFECACFLDAMAEMDTWVRNIPRRVGQSFWLQTATDKFYPDFVCRLKDGRFLAVEYKGGHLLDASDAKEKKILGELWEKRSGGACLFVMPSNRDFDAIRLKTAHG
jgi:type III restriction enzyme